MTTIKVLGVCCNTECSKKKMGKCQNYRPSVPDDETCKYCGCDAGAHTLLHYEVLPVVPPPPLPTAPEVKKLSGGPALQSRKLIMEERTKIFQTASPASTTPNAKRKAKQEVVDLATEEVKKPQILQKKTDTTIISAEEVKKPKILHEDSENNRRTDRAAVLEFAPEGMTKTDLDMGQFYKVNKEFWMPPVTNSDPVTDYTTYCFACHSQLKSGDREPCAGASCERFMFVECGHYGPLLSEDETEDDVSPTLFRCCDCKQASYQRQLYQDYMSELPPKNSTSRFSDAY